MNSCPAGASGSNWLKGICSAEVIVSDSTISEFTLLHEIAHIKNNDSVKGILTSLVCGITGIAASVFLGMYKRSLSFQFRSVLDVAATVTYLGIMALFITKPAQWNESRADAFATKHASDDTLMEAYKYFEGDDPTWCGIRIDQLHPPVHLRQAKIGKELKNRGYTPHRPERTPMMLFEQGPAPIIWRK